MRKIYLFSLLFLPSILLFSQNDAHYWTHQYGSKGLLLNGAVIAGPEDETAVYYNPGAMGNGEDFGVSLTFFTPAYSVLTTKGLLGQDNEIRDRDFGFTPGFGAVGLKPFKNPKIRMVFTSFTRFRSNLGSNNRVVGKVENQDNAIFIGNLEFNRRVSTRWFGLGTAYKFNEKLAVGLTQFGTFHSEGATLQIGKEIVNEDNPTNLQLGWRSLYKWNLNIKGGMLTKIGLSATFRDVKIGLTATTPTYHHLLEGAGYEIDDLRTYGRDSTVLVSNRNGAELKNYKTPWSFGFGLDFKVKRTRISFSMEYFLAQDIYTAIDDIDDPFDGVTSETFTQRTVVRQGEKEVLNVALGVQTEYNDKVTLIWGLRTDFNQRIVNPNLESLSFLSTTPNIYHASLGGFFHAWENQFSLGVDYAFGLKRRDTRIVDFSNITAENLFEINTSGRVQSNYNAFVLIFTYDFIVKSWKDRKKILEDRNKRRIERLKKKGYLLDDQK